MMGVQYIKGQKCKARDPCTFQNLYAWLEQGRVRWYCTVKYQVYSALIPANRLAMSKRVTRGRESSSNALSSQTRNMMEQLLSWSSATDRQCCGSLDI